MASVPTTFNDFARDLARLVTSNSPSTALISSSTWNVTASSIVDATPAGWTYVGSNYSAGEMSSIAAVNGGSVIPGINSTSAYNWVVKSACLAPNTSKYKYVAFNSIRQRYYENATYQYPVCGSLSMCESSTSGGTLTNEAVKVYSDGTGTINWGSGLVFYNPGTYHLIANARHITLIKENYNVQAVWEHSNTDLHTRFGQTPSVYYSWSSTAVGTAPSFVANTGIVSGSVIGAVGDGAWLCNITDVTSGTIYGVVNVTGGLSTVHSPGTAQPYLWPNLTKGTSVNSSGATRQLVSPIMFQYYNYGYPTMYVTGVSPVYMCKGNIGAAGDNISVAGSDYIYIPVNAALGLAVKSS